MTCERCQGLLNDLCVGLLAGAVFLQVGCVHRNHAVAWQIWILQRGGCSCCIALHMGWLAQFCLQTPMYLAC